MVKVSLRGVLLAVIFSCCVVLLGDVALQLLLQFWEAIEPYIRWYAYFSVAYAIVGSLVSLFLVREPKVLHVIPYLITDPICGECKECRRGRGAYCERYLLPGKLLLFNHSQNLNLPTKLLPFKNMYMQRKVVSTLNYIHLVFSYSTFLRSESTTHPIHFKIPWANKPWYTAPTALRNTCPFKGWSGGGIFGSKLEQQTESSPSRQYCGNKGKKRAQGANPLSRGGRNSHWACRTSRNSEGR